RQALHDDVRRVLSYVSAVVLRLRHIAGERSTTGRRNGQRAGPASANADHSSVPTYPAAMHFRVLVQEMPLNTLLSPSGVGLGTIVQVLPFHSSISVANVKTWSASS